MDGSGTLQAAILEWTSGVRGVGLMLGLLLVVAAAFLVRRGSSRDVHKRGTRIVAATGVWRRRFNLGGDDRVLRLAGVRITPLDETKHFKLIGTTGTGKSTAIRELLGCALDRGDRAVIADPDAGYLQSFYDRYRGDVVLNPFEEYGVKWDLF